MFAEIEKFIIRQTPKGEKRWAPQQQQQKEKRRWDVREWREK